MKHKFIIISDFEPCQILDADFLMKHGMVLDFRKNQLQWASGDVELIVE